MVEIGVIFITRYFLRLYKPFLFTYGTLTISGFYLLWDILLELQILCYANIFNDFGH